MQNVGIKVYTDGAARGNPGPSASGYAVYAADGKIIRKGVRFNGIATNNFAEYTAIIASLEWCSANLDHNEEITLYSDSRLVVSQIRGDFKVKNETMKALWKQARKLASDFPKISFVDVRRSDGGVSEVDARINKFLDARARNAAVDKKV